MATTRVFLYAGTTSWTVPAGVTLALVECVGCGGHGLSFASYRYGGGGGAYARKLFSGLTPGAAIDVQVGAGGAADSTWFDSAAVLKADYGRSFSTAPGAAGGQAANSVGDLVNSGGNGGYAPPVSSPSGSGGGGAGGPAGPGGPGGGGGTRGGGGGGANGGGAGGAYSIATGPGVGGLGPGGAAGGSAGTSVNVDGGAGSQGSGGGGSWLGLGGAGSHNGEWDASHGLGSGGGGGRSEPGYTGGAGGGYGGGGGAAGGGGVGAPGLIVITYGVIDFTGAALTTAAPALGAPAITQLHALSAPGLSTAGPAVGVPAVLQLHNLSAGALTLAGPAISIPAMGQVHALAATPLTTGPPILDAAHLTVTYAFTSPGLVTGAPVLGRPRLMEVQTPLTIGRLSRLPNIRAVQDEPLDLLVWRASGRGPAGVEAALAANPGLSLRAHALPEGWMVALPAAASDPAPAPLIQLWD